MTPRPTVRPVTLPRLVETAHICADEPQDTGEVSEALDVSRRRSRETILETVRLGFVSETDDERYGTTEVGSEFVEHVMDERWRKVNEILLQASPHYENFLATVSSIGPCSLDEAVEELNRTDDSHRSYNRTSAEVLGDWGERLGSVQRNAFTGEYYTVENQRTPKDFISTLLSVYDELEENAGVNLRQRYLSIPKLRERFCQEAGCTRKTFDTELEKVAKQNVGSVELSGAPIDTGAKESLVGIKKIERSGEGDLVSTSQSTDTVMSGVEQYGKKYYYLAIHDRNIEYDTEDI